MTEPEETTTLTILHSPDMDLGIIAAIDEALASLDYIYEWTWV